VPANQQTRTTYEYCQQLIVKHLIGKINYILSFWLKALVVTEFLPRLAMALVYMALGILPWVATSCLLGPFDVRRIADIDQ